MKYKIKANSAEEFPTLELLAGARASVINKKRLFVAVDDLSESEIGYLKAVGFIVQEDYQYDPE